MVRRLVLGVWGVLATAIVSSVVGVQYAPNHFLGTCLDDKWVKDVETKLNISSTARDDQMRLEQPHLHGALPTRRFTFHDKRIDGKTLSQIFTTNCTKMPFTFWGVGAKVDPTTGAVTAAGSPNGSLVAEYKNWASSQLVTLVFSIIAQEVLGYNISFYFSGNAAEMGARMSSSNKEGQCTPVHANLEEWGRDFSEFMNEMYKTGTQGYVGRSGLYTTKKLVNEGLDKTKNNPVFNADFYRDFANSDGLIAALDADLLFKNKDYYPVTPKICADGVMGCKDSCSRTDTCTTREQNGGKCVAFALMYPTYDDGKTEAILANNKIPSYHCFLGFSGVEKYAVEMESKDIPVAFYHFEPDPFHYVNENKFSRIFLPRSTPELAMLNTAQFGENGYGKPTNNPVSVDYPLSTLNLYASNVVQDHPPMATLLSRMTFNELDISTLLKTYVAVAYKGATAIQNDDPVFSSACAWVRDNYAAWKLWLDRLPLCSLVDHIQYSFQHCNDGKPREIRWSWKEPHPLDATKPYTCDGGFDHLPTTLVTSKTCEWLAANAYVWYSWTVALPDCDAQFYSFRVSDCNSQSMRTAEYFWLLSDSVDPTNSLECRQTGGVSLPKSVELACEFTPYESALGKVVAILAGILAAILVGLMIFVVKYKHEPIIKRSQYEFLLAMITGGIMLCGSAVVYGGEPTRFLCATRPLVTALGFTLIFGSLVVKSLRVYRVFMSGAMKRVVLSTATMFKILGIFVSVDLLIVLAWFVADFPKPHLKPTTIGALNGASIDYRICQSSSFIFSALLIFWKAIVLFMGLYISFLIRNVSTDFQESIWIFASSLVVLFASVIILPMAYLVELPANIFYAFLAFMLLGCTAAVMSMMLVPKIRRLHERANDTTTMDTRPEMTSNSTSGEDAKPNTKVSKIRLGMKAQVSVTPVEEFRPRSVRGSHGLGASDNSDED